LSLAFQTFGGNAHGAGEASGDSPDSSRTIVLLHGLFGSGDNLRLLARGLESRYAVVVPDLPNHGMSPHIDSSTHEKMVEVIEHFIDEQGFPNPILAGHSIGGKLAMLMALRHPGRYPAVVSIDMAPRRYEASHREIMAAMRAMPLHTVHIRKDADQLLSSAVPDAAVRAFLLKNLVRNGEEFQWRLNLDAIANDYDSLLGWDPPESSYNGPALFVGGERSRYLQAHRDTEEIRRFFPTATITMIPDAGHWLHADKPEELLAIMNRFFSGFEQP